MKVVVIGAGAAGLRTAQLLHREGLQVVVVEARDRIGGRLDTFPGTNGYYDAGGEWIDSDHRRVLNLMSDLGIECESTEGMGGWLCFGDRKWAEDQPSLEMLKTEADLLAFARQEMANPNVVDRTLADVIDSVSDSIEGKWYVTAKYRSDEGEDLDRVGWRCWLQAYRLYAERAGGEMSQYRVVGGAQSMCNMMALTLPSVELEREVIGIAQTDEDVTVRFKDGSLETSSYVIVTCPPPIVSSWNWDPALPTLSAWKRARMGCAVKVAMRFDSKFWEEHGFPGRLLVDRCFQQLWDSSHGDFYVLQFYVCGREARRFANDYMIAETWISEASKYLPSIRQHLLGYAIHDWCSDAYAQGGFSTWGPDDDREVKPFLIQPQGRVHFAGEHTATWCGFIEGALESAERVAQEVLCRS